MADAIIRKIGQFGCPQGTPFADAAAPVARQRRTAHDGCSKSCTGHSESSGGPPWALRRTILSIDDALQFIAAEDIFWIMTGLSEPGKCGKSSSAVAKKLAPMRYRTGAFNYAT